MQVSPFSFVRLPSRGLRAARRADIILGRLGGRCRVLFEARAPLNLAVLRPVLEALRRDARFDLLITHDRRRADIVRALQEPSLAPLVISRQRAAWTRIDLYVNSDPWSPACLHRAARRLNFFHGVAGKYNLDDPARDAALFTTYDKVAFVNSDRMHRYLSRGIVSPRQAVLVGYPKLDALLRGAYDARAVRAALGFDVSRPTAIYAPTWSPASSLHVAGELIVESLLARGLNVIAKLHDNCFLLDEKYAAGIDWRQRLGRFRDTGRFALVDDPDASQYLAASDILVTDHSSIGFEFMVLDRPVAIFDAPDLQRVAKINPEKVALLRSAATVASTPAQLAEQVVDALAHPAERSGARRRIAGEMFYQPGTATARAIAIVYELLGLPATSSAMMQTAAPAEAGE